MSAEDDKLANLYERMVQDDDISGNGSGYTAKRSVENSPLTNSRKDRAIEKGFDQLQPITTQQNFNIKLQKRDNSPLSSMRSEHNHMPIQSPQKSNDFDDFLRQPAKPSPRYKEEIEEESKKFRQYLNEKVEQLRKSKNEHRTADKKNSFSPVKNSNSKQGRSIRDIIKQEESKQISKKSIVQQNQNAKPNATSMSAYKQINSKANTNTNFTQVNGKQRAKKFSNSHSNLNKSNNAEANDVKIGAQVRSKLPILTPPIKANLPKQSNTPNPKDTQSTLQGLIEPKKSSNSRQSQKRQTAQSKNSFRIKRTQNNSNKSIPQTQNPTQKRQNSITVNNPKPPKANVTSKKIQSENVIKKATQSPTMMSKNKRIRQEFIRLNQQQKVLQREIFDYHNQTKDYLEAFQKKYTINMDAFTKYGCKPTLLSKENIKKSPSKKRLSESKVVPKNEPDNENNENEATLKQEEDQTGTLVAQIQKIQDLLRQRERGYKKAQSKITKNAYLEYLRTTPQDILEMEEDDQQEEQDEVKNLGVGAESSAQRQVGDTTYSTSMSDIKSKKWGLKQRITFETHREGNNASKINFNPGQSKLKGSTSNKKANHNQSQEDYSNSNGPDESNRIAVNSRLKNLLLD